MVDNDMQRVIDDVARKLESAYTNTFGQTRHEFASSSIIEVDEGDVCSITIELLQLPCLQNSIREELVEAEVSYRQFPHEALISFETEETIPSATYGNSVISNGGFAYKDEVDDADTVNSTTDDETETFDSGSTHASLTDEYYNVPSRKASSSTAFYSMTTPRNEIFLPVELIAARLESGGKGDAASLKYANTAGCNNLRPLRLVRNSYLNIDDVQSLNSLFMFPFPLYVLHLVVDTTPDD